MKSIIGIIGLSGQSVMLRTDHFHQKGETVTASSLFREPGGKGYNQAVAAVRLGAQVRYLSCIGGDPAGDECAERMEREGVQARWVRSALPTAYATILTDKAGENQVTVFRGAADALTAADVLDQEAWLAECDVLLLQLECPMRTLETALEIAQRHCIPAYLNPAPACPVPEDWLSRFALLLPNAREAMQLLNLEGELCPRALRERMLAKGLKHLLVTLGEEGALYVSESGVSHWRPPQVHALDTTGAGDTFCAAFALARLRKASIEAAARFAMKAAAFCVQRPHVLDALPYLWQLDQENS